MWILSPANVSCKMFWQFFILALLLFFIYFFYYGSFHFNYPPSLSNEHTNQHPVSALFSQKFISDYFWQPLLEICPLYSAVNSPLFEPRILKGSWSVDKDRWWRCGWWCEKLLTSQYFPLEANTFGHNVYSAFCVPVWSLSNLSI